MNGNSVALGTRVNHVQICIFGDSEWGMSRKLVVNNGWNFSKFNESYKPNQKAKQTLKDKNKENYLRHLKI